MSDQQFEQISSLVKRVCGINLHNGKQELVRARLSKRLRQLGLDNFNDYLDYLASDPHGGELITMMDMLSTNVTQFFRESRHFDYLKSDVLPALTRLRQSSRRLRVWSAGCSSGEEPYSLAVLLTEELADLANWDARILATDLSTRVLDRARAGQYPEAKLKDVPGMWKAKHFEAIQTRPEKIYAVSEGIRRLITFARLNLLDPWPMRGPFDLIFCRNVMIYFDKSTQSTLVNRFYDLLGPGGYLFLGHSESLAGVKHRFDYVEPTIYRRP